MKKLEANQLSNQQNTEILERLFEEAYQEIKEDNILQLNEDDLIFAAKTRAERRIEYNTEYSRKITSSNFCFLSLALAAQHCNQTKALNVWLRPATHLFFF